MAKAIKWEAILDSRRYERGADRIQRRNRDLASGFGGLGAVAKRVAGPAAIGALIVGATKLEKEWGDATDKIRTGTGKTGKAWGGLVKDFNKVAVAVPVSLMDVGTAIADLNARTGQTGKGLQDLAKRELALARVTETDLKTNIAATTRLFGDWSIKTENQAGTLDKLFRASQATGAGVDVLAQSVVQFGSPLRQLGFDLDTTVALFGEFERTGVNIQTALPGLRMALKNFAAAGREPAPALMETIKRIKEAGSTAEANKLAFKTFGVRAGPDLAAAIREGHFDLDKLIKTIAGGHDTIMAAERDTEGFTEAWQRFTNLLKVQAGPIITKVFDAAGERVTAFTGLVQRDVIPAVERTSRQFAADLRPELDRVRQAWDDNKQSILGLVSQLSSADAGMASTEGHAKSLATALGDIGVEGVKTGGGVAKSLSGLDQEFRKFTESSTRSFEKLGEGMAKRDPLFRGLREWLLKIDGGAEQVATSTDRAATAADRHATALRAEKDALSVLQGALDDEKASEIDLRQAKLNVATAQSRVNDLKADGKTKSFEYKQAQLDLERAQIDLAHKTDDYKNAQRTASAATAGAMHASQGAARAHRELKRDADKAGVAAWLMGGKIKDGLLRIPKGRTIVVRARAAVDISASTRMYLKAAQVPGFHATGGAIHGPGTGTSDSVPAWLSTGEHVWTAREVAAAGGHAAMQRWRAATVAGEAPRFQAGGGVGLRFSADTSSLGDLRRWHDAVVTATGRIGQRLADSLARSVGKGLSKAIEKGLGGGSTAIKAFIRSTDPLPYRWGAAGPGAYDCSGLVSAVLGKMTGRGGGHGQRYFTTSSIRSGILGIKPGLGGVLQIGVTAGTGHMAGRYGGLGFEAESTRTGIKVGAAASRPESFARHFHLAKGGRVDEDMLARFAALTGADIGGDFGRLRINGKVLDDGGWLMPREVGVNLGSKPERVVGPAETMTVTLDAASRRALVRELTEAFVTAGVGASYLDSRQIEQVLAGARISNARR